MRRYSADFHIIFVVRLLFFESHTYRTFITFITFTYDKIFQRRDYFHSVSCNISGVFFFNGDIRRSCRLHERYDKTIYLIIVHVSTCVCALHITERSTLSTYRLFLNHPRFHCSHICYVRFST